MATLQELRAELDALDRELIELAARRQQLVREIGKAKTEAGAPTRDFARERVVIERARRNADELGLDAHLAERLMTELIRSSLARQESDRISGTPGSKGSALVIGGAGLMGNWFASFLAASGYSVEVADQPGTDSPYPRCDAWSMETDRFDLIALATPIGVTQGIMDELEKLRPKALILDLCSVKGPLRTRLRALADAGLNVASLHPMFGPDTQLLSGRHVVVLDVGVEAASDAAAALFEATMARIVRMSLEDHDRLIAYVLGLSHVLNIAFFTALRESGAAAEQLAELSSTTFDAQLAIAGNVAGENARMYFEIQSLNDYQAAPHNALIGALSRIRNLVEAGDERGFARLMGLGRKYLEHRRSSTSN